MKIPCGGAASVGGDGAIRHQPPQDPLLQCLKKGMVIMPEKTNLLPLKAIPMGDNTYCIEDNMVRCFLFIGTERALLVDAGFGGDDRSLRQLVEPLTDRTTQLVITHADPDHIGAAAEFDAVYMHISEVERYTEMAHSTGPRIIPLEDSSELDIGGRRFEVLHVPGHTRGSIALLDREGRLLVAGDSVSGMPVFMFGEGRDLDAYLTSMKKLSALKDAFDVIYPAHGTLPLPPEQIDKLIAAGEKLRAGALSPQEPPFPMPAKMYVYDGAGFYI